MVLYGEEEEDFSTFSNKKDKDAATTLLQKAPLLQKVDDLMGEKKFQFFFFNTLVLF